MRLLPLVLTTVSVFCAGAAITAMLIDDAFVRLITDTGTWVLRDFSLGMFLVVAAWVVLRRNARHGAGIALLIASAGLSLATLGVTLRALPHSAGAFMAGGKLADIRGIAILAQHGALATLPLFTPGGRLVHRRWRYLLYGLPVAYLLYLAPLAWYGRDIHDPSWTNAVMETQHPWWKVCGTAIIVLGRGAAAAAAVTLAVRMRHSTGLRRRQLGAMLVCHLSFWVVSTIYTSLPGTRNSQTRFWPDLLVQGPSTLTLVMITVVVVASADLSRVVRMLRWVLVLGGLGLGIWLTYSALIAMFAAVLSTAANTAFAAILSVLLVRPLMGLLWRGATWLFYGRTDPYTAVGKLATHLRDHRTVDEIAQVVCDTVVRTMALPSAALQARIGENVRMLAVAGDALRWVPDVPFPMHHNGELAGQLLVAARPGERALDKRDAAVLQTLVDQMAPVVSAVRLREELLASRERIVTSREEERRRLRRDLHDGLGPSLAGIRFRLDAARDRLGVDSIVRPLLDESIDEVVVALGEIRRIIENLRPLALDDLGFRGALHQLANRLGVCAHLPEAVPALPAATEVAAYSIAAEALTNAVRHSAGDRTELYVAVNSQWLTMTITDNGTGLLPDTSRGLGLRSMAERAEEIGGSVAFTGCPGGGTTVHAQLPCRTQ